MAGDDVVVIVDEDRIGEAERGDAVGNLPDVFLEWVRALAGNGRRRAIAIGSMVRGFI